MAQLFRGSGQVRPRPAAATIVQPEFRDFRHLPGCVGRDIMTYYFGLMGCLSLRLNFHLGPQRLTLVLLTAQAALQVPELGPDHLIARGTRQPADKLVTTADDAVIATLLTAGRYVEIAINHRLVGALL